MQISKIIYYSLAFLEGLNHLNTLNINQSTTITKIIAITGATRANTDITIEVPDSTVETIGLATPPVVAVEASLAELVEDLIAVAVPPPAIIAKDQVTTGSRSAIVDNITAVPAMAAKGTAMVSNKLSNQGIK